MPSPATKYTSKLAGQRVLVLGGTSGIGYAVAEAAVEHGARVTVSSSQQSNVSSALESLRNSYPPGANGQRPYAPTGHVCDISQKEKLEGNIESLLKAAAGDSKINHVVITAGDIPSVPSLANITADWVEKLGTVRFISVLIIAKLLPSYMDLDSNNSFTLTGGVSTRKPIPGWSVLIAYGGALEALARGLAVDLKPVRTNLVAPGAVHTPLLDKNVGEARDAMLEKVASETTVGAIGRPEDVAEAYLYSMKDRFVTGTVIESNGGRLLV